MGRPRKPAASEWSCDFETNNEVEDCRIWSWAAVEVDRNPIRDRANSGTNIYSFANWCSRENRKLYFHNLAFDGAFILDHLLNCDYRHTTDRPGRGEFSTVIDKMGKFYKITIAWPAGNYTEIVDSLKRIPMPVSAIGPTYGLPISKGSIDYSADRPIGYEPTEDEWDYIFTDVEVVAMALAIQKEQGMSKLTVGSDAMSDYKSIITSESFKSLFPLLPLETDLELRAAYRGGFTYADPRFSRRVVGEGNTYDVNSLYPSVMYDRKLPYGEPIAVDDIPTDGSLWIASFTFTAKIKKDHIPCIQVKGSNMFVGTEYLSSIDEPLTLAVTSVDWELWNNHYDIDVYMMNGCYKFKSTKGLFTSYIDKWMKVKTTTDGGQKAIAKLFLNSLYGKFGTNPDKTGKVPELVDNVVRLKTGPENIGEPIYVPMAAFITAYARQVTITAAQNHYGQFAYADTDSLHLIGDDPDDLDVDPDRLGAWKHEHKFAKALFARAKCYTELVYGTSGLEWDTHIAGLPRSVSTEVRFSHYFGGTSFTGKLQPVRVRGGVVLRDVEFQLRM